METFNKGIPSRALPQPVFDNIQSGVQERVSRYGESYAHNLISTKHSLADEGSYFALSNPTLGTQVTFAVRATFLDTAAMFAIRNGWTPGDSRAKRVYLDFVKLLFTGTPVIPASAISAIIAVKIDDKDRTPSAGFRGPDTPSNVNMDDGTISKAQIYQFSAGEMTVPASGPSARLAARAVMKSAIPVTQDELVTYFGPIESSGSVGTGAGRYVSHCNPAIIGPQQWAVVHIWFPSNATTAGQFEYELGLFER
jgi:hypothetical protein